MKRNFAEWLLTFTDSIADYKYYIDFETIYRNAEEHKLEWGRGEFRDDPNDSDAILDSRSSNNYWGKPTEINNTPN